jgi:hypothetical protein
VAVIAIGKDQTPGGRLIRQEAEAAVADAQQQVETEKSEAGKTWSWRSKESQR